MQKVPTHRPLLVAEQGTISMQKLWVQNYFTKWNCNARQQTSIYEMVYGNDIYERNKKGFSAAEMQRQIGHKRYEPIWAMVHKLRAVMGKREDLYKLKDIIEFDEGHFEVATSQKKRQNLKRGKGSQRQKNVAVMAESTPLEDLNTKKKSTQCRYFKMKVLGAKDADEINKTIRENIDEKSIVLTDRATTYVDIAKYIETHITEKSNKETTSTTLKWVHIAIANAKRNFLESIIKLKANTYRII